MLYGVRSRNSILDVALAATQSRPRRLDLTSTSYYGTSEPLKGRSLPPGGWLTARDDAEGRHCVVCQATDPVASVVPEKSVSVVLLAGGSGKRMGASIPKQYLELSGRAIATYSLETFAKMAETLEIVIVCDPSWRYIFEDCVKEFALSCPLKWALPGKERQDSVYNGFSQIDPGALLVSIHDSARPLVRPADVQRCLEDGYETGAAVLGVKVKPTIKEVDGDLFVQRTLERAKLWEVQTPQVAPSSSLAQLQAGA